MPEITIDKNYDSGATKRQIGLADEILTAYAKAKALTPESPPQDMLGLSISRTNSGHVARYRFGRSGFHRIQSRHEMGSGRK